MPISQQEVLKALSSIQDPEKKKDIVSLGYVKDLKTDGGKVHFRIELTIPPGPLRDQLREEAERNVSRIPGVSEVTVFMTSLVQKSQKTASTPSVRPTRPSLIPSVRHVIPVASGKGGVGKSTVSVNLALSLLKLGARVGIMDADVYGPTVPTLLGIQEEPKVLEDNRIVPIEKEGLKVMSMGFFVKPDEAIVWRGPMLHKTMEQFLGGVVWGDLDYLIVDLNPGTGDIQLSLCQLIPMTGAVIVSTPQDVSLNVAAKAITMFHKLNAPILGIVENMSYYICPHCGKREDLFGSGGARKVAQKLGIPFLGEVPLAAPIRIHSDEGKPIVLSEPDSASSKAFLQIAEKLAEQIALKEGGGPEGMQISEIKATDAGEVWVKWKDGHESLYPARDLRLACPCAGCVDEVSGQRRLDLARIPQDIHPLRIEFVGNYAVTFHWSDGHRTGIYSFERLRELCPSPKCR